MKKLKGMLVAVCLVLGIVAVSASSPARASTCYHYATSSWQTDHYVTTGNSAQAGRIALVRQPSGAYILNVYWQNPWFIAGEGILILGPQDQGNWYGSSGWGDGFAAGKQPTYVQLETAEAC